MLSCFDCWFLVLTGLLCFVMLAGVCLLDFACGFTSVADTLVVCGCLLVGQLFVCLFWVCDACFVCVCLGFVNWVIVWFTSWWLGCFECGLGGL